VLTASTMSTAAAAVVSGFSRTRHLVIAAILQWDRAGVQWPRKVRL